MGRVRTGSRTPGPSTTADMSPVRGRGEDACLGRADLHIHTSFSDGMADVPELLDWVDERTALDIIGIVDHDDVRGALATRAAWAKGRYRFEVVTGIEVTAIEGHVLALFVEEPVPSLVPLEQVLEAVHKQGGLCVVPHPLSWLTRSIGARTLARFAKSFDGIEVACCSPAARVSLRKAASLNRSGLGLAEMGGSDAHFLQAIGSAYTEFEGRTGTELKKAIVGRATRAAYGPPVAWRSIGLGHMARQTWRGTRATPRAMGWGPTARSFVRRIFHFR